MSVKITVKEGEEREFGNGFSRNSPAGVPIPAPSANRQDLPIEEFADPHQQPLQFLHKGAISDHLAT